MRCLVVFVILCGALSITAVSHGEAKRGHRVKLLGADHGELYHQRLDYGRVQQQEPGRSSRTIAPIHVPLETRQGLKHFLLLPTQTFTKTEGGARVHNEVVALELIVKNGKPQYYLGKKGKVDTIYSEVRRIANRRDKRRVRAEVERRGRLHCIFADADLSFDLPVEEDSVSLPAGNSQVP
jgi:hypothetical protein